MRYSDVFVSGGFPKHTYNPRSTRNLEVRLADVALNLCKLATVTGHTKSGKTVLVRNTYPTENAVWIDGGTIGEEEDFWSEVINQLELFQETGDEASEAKGHEVGATAEVEGNAFLVKGKGGLAGKVSSEKTSARSMARKVSSRVTALAGLRQANIPLVIDDFHYLSKPLQGSTVRALKALVFDGVPVILIAIPHRRYDALKVEKEMTGRILPLEIPLWELDELCYIAQTGFPLLNCEIEPAVVDSLAEQSLGSPHLMQDFCRAICRKFGVLTEQDGSPLSPTQFDLELIYCEVAETIGKPIFEKLARGPRQRKDRIARKLKNGDEVDIYGLVLRALAHMRPGLVTIEYEQLRGAIKEIANDAPQLQEVARVLKRMATIAASDESSTPVVDFEEEEKLLHVTDPFFAFYLRWGRLVDN